MPAIKRVLPWFRQCESVGPTRNEEGSRNQS